MSDHDTATEQPHLKRVLGRWDLVLLFVVAVFNLNVVPSIAANGGVTVWLGISVESATMKKRQLLPTGNRRKQEADMRDWADRRAR